MRLGRGACQEEVGAGGRGRQGEDDAAELLQRGLLLLLLLLQLPMA